MGKDILGSTKRFGSRYGRSGKHKLLKIEIQQKKLYKCPACHKLKAKRLSAGIWQCTKCNAKFANKAYTVSAPSIKAAVEE